MYKVGIQNPTELILSVHHLLSFLKWQGYEDLHGTVSTYKDSLSERYVPTINSFSLINCHTNNGWPE